MLMKINYLCGMQFDHIEIKKKLKDFFPLHVPIVNKPFSSMLNLNAFKTC